jgi:hypothetical protein
MAPPHEPAKQIAPPAYVDRGELEREQVVRHQVGLAVASVSIRTSAHETSAATRASCASAGYAFRSYHYTVSYTPNASNHAKNEGSARAMPIIVTHLHQAGEEG